MKRNIIKFLSLAMLLVGATAFTACNDTEAVDLVEPSIQNQNPELYAQYLQNLRAYKNSEHVLVYTWFDNSNKTPNSRAEHIADLPDSVDIVALTNPEALAQWELQEIQSLRSEKNIRFIYDVDFDAIKADYNALLEVATEEEPVSTDFIGYLVENLETKLSFADRFGFDGICIAYQGKSTRHMQAAALREYQANERAFFGILSNWHARHPNALLTFFGNPQNVADATLLADCLHLLVDGTSSLSADALTQALLLAQVEDLTEPSYGIVVNNFDVNDENETIGYFSDGSFAVDGLAVWAPEAHGDVKVQAVGVKGVSSDYFDAQKVYSHTRALISSVNPPIK
ncbi:MAG: hypothetical protein IJ816_05385 [Alloprevotella sp.]|nr:hypothetical protein [Alloprevotella sp.]